MQAPTLYDVAQWIVNVRKNLNPSIICKDFLKRCISNNLDSRKDDVQWEDDTDIEEGAEDDNTDTYDHGTSSSVNKYVPIMVLNKKYLLTVYL